MLECVSPYRSSLGSYLPGDKIDDPGLEEALLRDSPGSFESVSKAPLKAMAKPKHRAVVGDDD